MGNKYVELVPGTGGGSLSSGSELTIQSTTSPTDLDQLNAIFDKPTRDEMRQMTLQGKIALGGRAQTLNTDLEQLRNLAVAAEPVTGVIDTHQVALDRATIAFDTLTQKLASLLRCDNEGSRSDEKLSNGTTSRCAAGEDPYRHV